MDTLELVREFHEKFGHPIKDNPGWDFAMRCLRVGLISEELTELDTALNDGDVVGVIDALCDLQYVLDGAFLALGFHSVKAEAMAEVNRANMSKLGDDGKPILRADGKILKGPNYSPPDLCAILKNRGLI